MKPKTRPNVKGSIQALGIGEAVEFDLRTSSESTIRSMVSRVARAEDRKFRTFRESLTLKVTRFS